MSGTTVAVTGLGVVSPTGWTPAEHWDALLTGRSGLRPLDRFDASGYSSRLAGQVAGHEAIGRVPDRLLPQTDVSTRFALVAAQAALADAVVDPSALRDYDMGVVTANASGGFEFTHREFRKLWQDGGDAVSVYESFAWFYAVNTGQISIRHGMRGPGAALVAEQAGGLQALGQARRTIRKGVPLVVGGGVDSALDPWGWASQLSSGRVSPSDDPAAAYRPFSRDASGYVPGEGGALLVLEDLAAARARGAGQVYGLVTGFAMTFDPPPGSDRPPTLARAIRSALDDARLTPPDVDVVVADAAGVPHLDRAEADALCEVFGRRGVPVTTGKPLTGRLYSGGGPLDVVGALLALREGVVPPVPAGCDPVDDSLDLVLDAPRELPLRHALVLARGRGGFNAALVLSRA